MIYCIDTSSLIAAWNERYPIRNVPPFWENLHGLIAEGRLVTPMEVKKEIVDKEDGLYEWLKARPEMFQELEEDIQLSTKEVLARFPFLAKEIAGRKSADAFVIGLALRRGHVVVTEEGVGSEKRPRIPLVCKHFGVECINLLGLIQGEDWVI